MFEYPDFDPIAVRLGPVSVHWYGLMYLAGFIGAWYLARRRARLPGAVCSVQQVDDLIFYAAVGVIGGGRIGYMLFYGMEQLLDDPLSLFRIWKGGMSFHGGLLGVLLAMFLFARKLGRRFFEVTDFIAPLIPVGLGLGRIGNFINNELWGKATDVPWAVVVNGQARHPSQLYEAVLEGLLLFALLWLYSARPRPRMAVSGLFLLGYGMFRFGIEFIRMPDQFLGYLAWGWVTMGQVLTLPMIAAGGILLWASGRRPAEGG